MQRLFYAPVLVAFGLLLAACGGGGNGSVARVVPVATNSPVSGTAGDARQATINGQTIWVDANSGLALYTFANDGANVSNCTGGCLSVWPAHTARAGEQASGNFTIFTRSDGTLQWAYKTHPLYTFANDTVNANATGNGQGGFSLATP